MKSTNGEKRKAMSIFFMNFKRNMKAAFTTVRSGFREYICFIVALLMVQMLFCTLTISVNNNLKVEKQAIIDAGYDYHLSFENLVQGDENAPTKLYALQERQQTRNFEYKYVTDGSGRTALHVFIEDKYEATLQTFVGVLAQINQGYDHASLETTPLYTYETERSGVFSTLFPLLMVFTVLSYFLLTALFRIRLNHFKFTYAVYTTFGADFRKLFSAAFFEMLLLTLLSFLPSVVLSYAVSALLYLPSGAPFGFYFSALPVTLVFSLLCSLLSLVLPIKLLSRTQPVRLFKAEDNSNLVSSARKSKDFYKKSPVYLESVALWRFRRHILALLASTVSFAVVFLLGAYIAHAYTVRSDVKKPDFEVTAATNEAYARFRQFISDDIETNNGAITLEKTASDPYAAGGARADSVLPNLSLDKRLIGVSSFVDSPVKEDFAATEALEIRAFDEDALECFEDIYRYSYRGDPSKLLTDPDAVILSSTLAGAKALDVEPGDTVYLSTGYVPLPGALHIDEDLTTLATRFSGGIYTYRAFTVAAVVDNYIDYDNMLVYLSTCEKEDAPSGWERVTGEKVRFTSVRLYPESARDQRLAAMSIRTYLETFGDVTYTRSYNSLYTSIDKAKNHEGVILLLSFLILAVSPLAGVFSQILFYGKRKLEFDVIRAVGGTAKELKKIFLTDAAALMLLSGALYAGLSVLAVKGASLFLNSRYAFIFSAERDRATAFSAELPLLPFFAGLILTVLFAGAAVLIPALLYKRSSSAHIAADFDRSDE